MEIWQSWIGGLLRVRWSWWGCCWRREWRLTVQVMQAHLSHLGCRPWTYPCCWDPLRLWCQCKQFWNPSTARVLSFVLKWNSHCVQLSSTLFITQLQQLHVQHCFLSILKCTWVWLIVCNFHTQRSRCECECRRQSDITSCCSWPWWWVHGGLPSNHRHRPQCYGWCEFPNLSFLYSYGHLPVYGCRSSNCYIQVPDCLKVCCCISL
jgi:hypothetical protein